MPTMNLNVHRSAFNDVYWKYIDDYTRRYNVYYGSAGSGKSVFVIQKNILKALKSKRKYLVIRKVASTLRESIFQEFLTQLNNIGLSRWCKISQSFLKITLPNGSEFKFMGVDDPEKLKSISGITDIIVEEATELDQEDFDQLDLRLRAKVPNQQMYLMLNPTSKANWIYKRWFSGDIPVDDRTTFILKTTYKDNRFLPQEYIDTIERTKLTNPTYYKIYALGEFTTLDRLVFNNIERVACKNVDTGQRFAGIDFGFSQDPTAIVSGSIDTKRKILYITDEVCRREMFVEQMASELKRINALNLHVYCDSAEPRSIADLKRYGVRAVPCKKGKDSIIHGVTWLQQYKIVVDPSCTNVWEELNNYAYKKDRDGEYTNTPIDKFNHTLDALRYATEPFRLNVKLGSLPKHIFGL
jgi:phage terminase large subunit